MKQMNSTAIENIFDIFGGRGQLDLIDISMPLSNSYRMHTPEGVEDVQFAVDVIKQYDSEGGAGQIVRGMRARLHHGTHVDAPEHYVRGGAQVNTIPLSTYIGSAVVADVRHVGAGGAIGVDDLAHAVDGVYRRGDRLLIRTDWNDHYGEPDYVEKSPYLTVEATQWCVNMGFPLVGLDFAHTKDDPAATSRFYVTKYFCEHDVVPMGYVVNLASISKSRVMLIAMPLAIEGAEASPVRAVVVA